MFKKSDIPELTEENLIPLVYGIKGTNLIALPSDNAGNTHMRALLETLMFTAITWGITPFEIKRWADEIQKEVQSHNKP